MDRNSFHQLLGKCNFGNLNLMQLIFCPYYKLKEYYFFYTCSLRTEKSAFIWLDYSDIYLEFGNSNKFQTYFSAS